MSYARWEGGSDVYVYADVRGGFTCCGCARLPDRAATLEHLAVHIAGGDSVPDSCLERLRAELEEAAEEALSS